MIPAGTDTGVTVGPGVPLSAAYCAERSAKLLELAAGERDDQGAVDRQLRCAKQWRLLAVAMSTNTAMTRPREPDERRG